METSQPKSIIRLQNLLSQEGIDKLKKTFIEENFIEDESSLQIDYDKGIIEYYDSRENIWKSRIFEDNLVETLELAVNDVKREIDFYSIKLEGRQKIKFWYSILDPLEYIEEVNPFFKEVFQVLQRC